MDFLSFRASEAAEARFALHVCGRSVRELLVGAGHVSQVAGSFPRVQLNFDIRDEDVEPLRALLDRMPHQTIITPYSRHLPDLHTMLGSPRNHAILFDESAGKGRVPPAWPAPVAGVCCGYAGGLNTENLAANLAQIVERGASAFWIDIESGIRDSNDRFDLIKVRTCLNIAAHFLQSEPRPMCETSYRPSDWRGSFDRNWRNT